MEEPQSERDEAAAEASVPSLVEMLTDTVVAAAKRLEPESRMAVVYRIKPKVEQ